MGKVKDYIYFIIGFCVLAGIIVYQLGIFGKGQDIAKASDNKLGTIQARLSQTEFAPYDNTMVSGNDVISAIRTYSNANFSVIVKPLTNATTGKIYGSSTGTTTNPTSYDSTLTPSNSDYIEPTGNFKATVQKNTNLTPISITFEQQKSN